MSSQPAGPVALPPPHDEALEQYTFQMGADRARLALAVDLITDITIRLGHHRVYTHAPTGKTKRDADVEAALLELDHIRKLLLPSLVTNSPKS